MQRALSRIWAPVDGFILEVDNRYTKRVSCVCLCVYHCTSFWEYLRVRVCVSFYVHLIMYFVYAFVCVCVCVCACVCVCVCLLPFLCVYECLWVCVSASLLAALYVYLRVPFYAYIFLSECLLVFHCMFVLV